MSSLVESFTRNELDVVTVPIQAVTLRQLDEKNEEAEPEEVVVVMESGQVKQVPVETGISDDQYIHIREGINADVKVVTGPYTTLTKVLKDSMKVELKRERGERRQYSGE